MKTTTSFNLDNVGSSITVTDEDGVIVRMTLTFENNVQFQFQRLENGDFAVDALRLPGARTTKMFWTIYSFIISPQMEWIGTQPDQLTSLEYITSHGVL